MASPEQVFVPNTGTLSELAAWIAGDLAGARAHLYDQFRNPQPGDSPADYHESGFVGYAPIAPLNWAAPFINFAGKAETDTQPLIWQFTAGVGTALVYGWYLTDSLDARLLLVCPFGVPITLSPGAPFLTRSIRITAAGEL